MKKISYDFKKWLLDENVMSIDFLNINKNFNKAINRIKKIILDDIKINDIEYSYSLILELEKMIKDEKDITKLSKVINMYDKIILNINNNYHNYHNLFEFSNYLTDLKNKLEIKRNEYLYKDDYIMLNHLISQKYDIEIIKYLLLSKEIKIDFYKIIDEIINYYININIDDLEEIEYYKKLLLLLIINMPKEVLSKNRNKYLMMIKNSDNYNSYINEKDERFKSKYSHIKNLYNRISTYSNITLDELEKKYNVNFNFNDNIIKESANFSSYSRNKINLTNQHVLTIDGKNTECIDDAFYVEKLSNGNYRLYVHITDIPSIIKKDSLTDNEALKRGSNLYLFDRNITMFPTNICNNICSLTLGNIKNVITYQIDFDQNFNIILNNVKNDIKIFPSIIRVINKYTYESADMALKNNKVEMLNYLINIAYKLKNQTKEKEKYRELQNKKDLVNNIIKPKESKYTDIYESSNIVQELMILVNRITASYFNNINMPFMYRNNVRINNNLLNDKMEDIIDYICDNDLKLNELNYKKLRDVMEIISSSGYYSITNKGHYGLSFDSYSHSTSPARRYADVVSQRLLYDFVFNENISNKNIYEWENNINVISDILNKCEKENYMFEGEYNFLVRKKLLKKETKEGE